MVTINKKLFNWLNPNFNTLDDAFFEYQYKNNFIAIRFNDHMCIFLCIDVEGMVNNLGYMRTHPHLPRVLNVHGNYIRSTEEEIIKYIDKFLSVAKRYEKLDEFKNMCDESKV